MTSPSRRRLLWVLLVLCIPAAVVLGRGAIAFRDEYAAFQSSTHEVPRPETESALPPLQDLVVEVPGGASLAAWYLPGRSGAAVLLVHGSRGDRATLWPEARVLAAAGYGVMLVDMPGHGESAGPVDWGNGGRQALAAAITTLAAQPEVDPARVGALGYSMGGMLVAQVAAIDQRIRAVVLSGCFSDARRQTLFEFRQWGPVTQWPALLAYRLAGFDDLDQRPIDVIGKLAPRPLLIVHGLDDGTVPASMAEELHAAAGDSSEVWLVAGAGHGGYMQVEPERWPERLLAFFAKALPSADGGAPAAATIARTSNGG